MMLKLIKQAVDQFFANTNTLQVSSLHVQVSSVEIFLNKS